MSWTRLRGDTGDNRFPAHILIHLTALTSCSHTQTHTQTYTTATCDVCCSVSVSQSVSFYKCWWLMGNVYIRYSHILINYVLISKIDIKAVGCDSHPACTPSTTTTSSDGADWFCGLEAIYKKNLDIKHIKHSDITNTLQFHLSLSDSFVSTMTIQRADRWVLEGNCWWIND